MRTRKKLSTVSDFYFVFFHPARADQAIIYIYYYRLHRFAGVVQTVPCSVVVRDCYGGGGERERSIKCQPVYLELSSSLLYIRPRDLPSDRGGPKTIQLPRIGTMVGWMGTGWGQVSVTFAVGVRGRLLLPDNLHATTVSRRSTGPPRYRVLSPPLVYTSCRLKTLSKSLFIRTEFTRARCPCPAPTTTYYYTSRTRCRYTYIYI